MRKDIGLLSFGQVDSQILPYRQVFPLCTSSQIITMILTSKNFFFIFTQYRDFGPIVMIKYT